MVRWDIDYSKFEKIEDPEPKSDEGYYLEPDEALNKSYEAEMSGWSVDKLREMKIKLAMDAYERRRPKDTIMHHYVIKDAGDPDAVGEYHLTGEMRNMCPIYKNANGITLSREKQPKGDSDEEQFGWILGSIDERRPLYGVMTDDLSVPTLGWQGFTAPEPVPTIRYLTNAAAARGFKDKGNSAMAARNYTEAESFYGKALECNLDPFEYSEPLAIILSNRAQVRLLMLNYTEASNDADQALKHLQTVIIDNDATKLLKQKAYLRRAKALAGMKLFYEAENTMTDASYQFPESEEIMSTLRDMQLARSSDENEGLKSGPSAPVLRFLGQTVEEMQKEIENSATALGDTTFPAPLTKTLLKLEYMFSKADGGVLADMQSLLRTNGGLGSLVHVLEVQWKCNLEGKRVDMDKLDSLCTLLSVLSLGAAGEGLQIVASAAPALLAALGGCNRKVDPSFCANLLSLVLKVFETCKSAALEVVQPCSHPIERAIAFLSRLVLTDDANGPDAPIVGARVKEKAAALINELLTTGGRVESRTLRGAAPMLATFDGTGFMTADDKSTRDLGEALLQKVQNDPSVLSKVDVTNLLVGVQLLIMYGPGSGQGVTAVPLEGSGTLQYVDLEKWASSEDGGYAAAMLAAVAKALEERLLGSHELGKDDYEEAFRRGCGWSVCIPLVQGPLAFSVPAMRCMGAMPSVPTFVAPAIGALLGFPSPESKPMASSIGKSLAADPAVRMSAAKLLSKCAESEALLIFLGKDGEKCMKELVKLLKNASLDGKSSLEAVHDMLHLFYNVAQSLPDPLIKHVPEDMMTMLVDIARAPVEEAPQVYAKGILATLKQSRKCYKAIKTIESKYDTGMDPAVSEAED